MFAIDHALLPIPCAQSHSMEETISEDNPQAGARRSPVTEASSMSPCSL
jgi:hypothetical protein